MKWRGLLSFTLLMSALFCASAMLTEAQTRDAVNRVGPSLGDIEFLKQRAQNGDMNAALRLGWSYLAGKGVPRDDQQAAKWFQVAATKGSRDAEFALGYLYEQGRGVERDYRQAIQYYFAAAKQGQASAENNLGSMLRMGTVCEKIRSKRRIGMKLPRDRAT